MEIDLFPDDGLVHDITTGVSYSDDKLWIGTYFGLSRYDGVRWKGYFDHDSGLASNFINFLKANGPVVWLCTDDGLSSFNGETWVTYRQNDAGNAGEVTMRRDDLVKVKASSSSIAHNFVIGVDFDENYVWVATAQGLSRGEKIAPVAMSRK